MVWQSRCRVCPKEERLARLFPKWRRSSWRGWNRRRGTRSFQYRSILFLRGWKDIHPQRRRPPETITSYWSVIIGTSNSSVGEPATNWIYTRVRVKLLPVLRKIGWHHHCITAVSVKQSLLVLLSFLLIFKLSGGGCERIEEKKTPIISYLFLAIYSTIKNKANFFSLICSHF